MAGQRRGEPPRNRSRVDRGFALLLALSVVASAACGDQGFRLPTAGGTGVGSLTTPGSSINGTWRHTLVVRTVMDVVTSETTWLFSGGGGCRRTVVSNSVLEGIPRTQLSPCSYSVAGGRVTVRYDGSSSDVSFTFVVSGNTLFLNGVEFSRIG